ncbi:MAG: radical SAM protein [Elusimicrobiota bacterium]
MPDAPFWQKCNSHCVMCTNSDAYINEPDARYGLAKHLRKIAEFKADPGDRNVYYQNGEHGGYFLFTGGEPTLNPDFLRLLAEYRKSFPGTPITLLTNGRLFCYEDFARETMLAGGNPFEVAVAVHGPDAAAHDAVTRTPGSFAETVEGLGHALKHRGPGQAVEIRVVLHRRTAGMLERTLRFLLETFPDASGYRLTLVYFEAEGQAAKNFERIRITLTDCAARVAACRGLLGRFRELRLYHFPLCVLPETLWPHAWRSLPRYEIMHVKACGACALNDVCVGPHDWYAERFGVSEFKPFQARRSLVLSGNPFHPIASVGEGTVPWTPARVVDEKKDEAVRW